PGTGPRAGGIVAAGPCPARGGHSRIRPGDCPRTNESVLPYRRGQRRPRFERPGTGPRLCRSGRGTLSEFRAACGACRVRGLGGAPGRGSRHAAPAGARVGVVRRRGGTTVRGGETGGGVGDSGPAECRAISVAGTPTKRRPATHPVTRRSEAVVEL